MSVRYIRACVIQDVSCLRNRILTQVICKKEQLIKGSIPFTDAKYLDKQIDYINDQMEDLENKINKIVDDYLKPEGNV